MVDDARTDIDELYDRLEVKEKTKEDIMKDLTHGGMDKLTRGKERLAGILVEPNILNEKIEKIEELDFETLDEVESRSKELRVQKARVIIERRVVLKRSFFKNRIEPRQERGRGLTREELIKAGVPRRRNAVSFLQKQYHLDLSDAEVVALRLEE